MPKGFTISLFPNAETLEKEWCFLGTDSRKRDRLISRLGEARKIDISDELDRIAEELKQPFLDWISIVGAKQRNPLKWWATAIASRSPMQTDLFLLLCYFALVCRWAATSEKFNPRQILIEDPWLYATLQGTLQKYEFISFSGSPRKELAFDSLKWLVRIPLAILYSLLRYSLLWIQCKLSIRDVVPNDAVMIFSWLDERSFAKPQEIRDPYTGRLCGILQESGHAVVRIAPIDTPFALLRKLQSSKTSFLITGRHLRLRDIFKSAFSRPDMDVEASTAIFTQCDTRLLLRRQKLREWGRPVYSENLLWYFTVLRMAADFGKGVKSIVYPFENQPWEKLLCLGWRQKSPSTKLIGYQHSTVESLLLSYFLGKNEASIMPLPDVVVANGLYTCALLARAQYDGIQIKNGGALRFERSENPGSSLRDRPTVLVALPFALGPAKDLFRGIVTEFQEPVVFNGQTVEFLIKSHPRFPLAKNSEPLPPHIRQTDRPLEQLVNSIDLLVYAGPSGSWLHAYFAGIPVLKFRTDELDVDTIISDGAVRICKRVDLREQLLVSLQPRHSQKLSIPRDDFWGKVDDDFWCQIVNGN